MKVIHFLAGLSLSVLLAACATIRGAGDVDQGRQALLEGNYQLALGYTSGRRASRPHLYIRHGATGRSLELFGQSPIPHRELCASASDFGKSAFSAQERQCRTAIPWPYVVSARRRKGGADEYPRRYAEEFTTGLTI